MKAPGYVVSKPLEWKLPNGTWSTGASLIGQNRDRTVLRLKDRAAGFGDPAVPKSVIVTASQNAAPDGGGNEAFGNYISDLTVNAGLNAGANGVDFLANNRGAMRNVVITAPAGAGNVGITMTRKYPGPAMIEDVAVRGFARGVLMATNEYGMTFENLRTSGQRIAGFENTGNIVSIRRMVSRNTVPAILNAGSVDVIESNLFGGTTGSSAITNQNSAFLRAVGKSGYSTLINDHGSARNMPANGEYSSRAPQSLTGTTHSLALPVPETPTVPNYLLSQWAGIGPTATTDWVDDTAALQAALNSGKPVVYLHASRVVLSATLDVPSTVKAIVGFDATAFATTGAFAGATNAAIFRVHGGPADNVLISSLVFSANPGVVDVENAGTGTATLRDLHLNGVPIRGGGTWYLDDTEGGSTWNMTSGQHIYASQFNIEHSATKVVNDGGTLWALGIKTERPSTVVDSRNGASTEILGGLVYPAASVPAGLPAFRSVDSKQSLSLTVIADNAASRYNPLISTTVAGTTGVFTPPSDPASYTIRVPLYADGF